MKFEINKADLDYGELKEKLDAQFPNYEFKMRGKQFLVAKKSSAIGANIVVRKGKLHVLGNFPTMGGSMLFMLILILLGVIIPIIIYFAAFHSKMKKLENEIGAFLQGQYGSNPDLLDK